MNLLDDLNEILQTELEKMGYQLPQKSINDLLRALFNLQNKTVSIKRRRVHISRELQSKTIEKPYNDYLKIIRNKFKNGKDVNPYLSERAQKPYRKDLLLYDWGINHLHINNKLNKKGFIERSDYLLFFVLREDDVYLIDVTKHRLEDGTEFAQRHLLKIIKDNWYFLISQHRLNGVTGVTEKFDDNQYLLTRNSGALMPIEIDGEVFALMGGGISTAKTSIDHTRKSDFVIMELRNIEDYLLKGQRALVKTTEEFNLPSAKTDFKLILKENRFCVIETNTENEICEAVGLYEMLFGHLTELRKSVHHIG